MTVWPLQSDLVAMRALFGNPDGNGDGTADLSWIANHLTSIVPPYQLYYAGKPVKTITVNKAIAPAVMRALTKVKALYPDPTVRAKLDIDRFDGCFNFRPKRSGSGSLSMHAYGVGIDWSAARNPFHAKKSDLPADFVKAFTDEGAEWGGGWSAASRDPMHIQFSRTH